MTESRLLYSDRNSVSGKGCVIAMARFNVVRRLHSRFVLAVGIAASSLPITVQAIEEVDVFSSFNAALPAKLKVGTIVGRVYLTPNQICKARVCNATRFIPYDDGQGNKPVIGPDIRTNVNGISARLLINGVAQRKYDDNYGYNLKIDKPVEIQYFVDGRSPSGNSDSFHGIHFAFVTKGNSFIRFVGEVRRIEGTCSVPAQNVRLPEVWVQKFGDVGSSIGVQNFQLRVNNCPKGYNRIGYTLDPVGGPIIDLPGILPLAAGSTAHGVNIRIANDKGVAVAFGKSIKVDAYDTAVGGSYSIPMQASYVKTDAAINPGTVAGAMTVLLDYQ
ncbi:fimbrial protein [Burkholderia contaminans]|uniref:fimbrial protein n=1 Tax=Burkholderia contaminans TaxID=488447 RepID=UPI001ABB5666|nr:fimbrial protein [Burkholderia contaminans]